MKPAGETQRSSTPATNQHLVIGRTLRCLMGNPAGYRANHHPPQCLQSSVGQKSKHCLPHIWHWLPTTRLKPKNGQKSSKSKKVKSQKVFYNSFRIISEVERLNFWNGTGCLKIALRTCFKTSFLDPPCITILSHSDLARGMKFSTCRVQRAILKNSDMIDP